MKCEKCKNEAIAITTTHTPPPTVHFYFIEHSIVKHIISGKGIEKLDKVLCKKHLLEEINKREMLGLLGSPIHYSRCLACKERMEKL